MEPKTIISNQTGQRSLVMITGAAGGLGKAFAVECANRGWDLFLTDLQPEPLEVLATSLQRSYGVRVLTRPCDLTEPSARDSLFERIQADGLQFWGLINVAGGDSEGPFFEQSCQQIRTIVRLNVEASLEMMHRILFLRDPLATFRIVNVASLAAFYPMPVKAAYAASKRFLLDFSLALGNELRESGVTVTALCPAGMPTTHECIQAIDAQGLLGQLTTQNTGSVAAQTLDAALKGRSVCIPGRLNAFLRAAGSLLPTGLVVRLIGWRWKSARQGRSENKSLIRQYISYKL